MVSAYNLIMFDCVIAFVNFVLFYFMADFSNKLYFPKSGTTSPEMAQMFQIMGMFSFNVSAMACNVARTPTDGLLKAMAIAHLLFAYHFFWSSRPEQLESMGTEPEPLYFWCGINVLQAALYFTAAPAPAATKKD